ncbi:hypothetical protein [Actinomadura rayongensis]|uniref:Uncharacterized protein n=1 Tax=Actinomadura rayongensis TaxID=1429076 RepID=A0A6I4WDW6_9ACTN|nr:hypothetical protein [Actinomadura rayongensis]
MSGCTHQTCFHVRIETLGADGRRNVRRRTGEDACGTHIADVVSGMARWAREQRADRAAHVIVYATSRGRSPSGRLGTDPFAALTVSIIPVACS